MRSYLIAFVFFGLIVAGILGYMREVIWLQNTIHQGGLLGLGAGVGALVGLVLALVLKVVWKKTDSVEVIQLFAACILGTALFMPLLASLYNRTFAGAVENQEVTFVSEKPYYKSVGIAKGQEMPANGYYLRFLVGTDTVRAELKSPKYTATPAGQTISIPIKKGALGYDVMMIE